MQTLLEEKDALTSETQELTKQRAKLELNIKDLRDEEAGDKTSKVVIWLYASDAVVCPVLCFALSFQPWPEWFKRFELA